jgi:hypothetical protein
MAGSLDEGQTDSPIRVQTVDATDFDNVIVEKLLVRSFTAAKAL